MSPPIDLNLLRVLDVLFEERGVTRAAARLGMTQSAVSHALARLRESLQDPLFVRTPQGMLPTARAEALAAPLRAALRGVEDALTGAQTKDDFDPQTAKKTFSLSTADYAGFLLLPRLAQKLEREAPFIDLTVLSATDEPVEHLENGEYDLCVGLKKHAKTGIRIQQILADRFVTIVRKDHPAVSRGRRMTLETFVELNHLLIAPHGWKKRRGFVDDALAELGKKRRVAMVVPHFLVAPHVIAQTDLVLTVAKRVADIFAAPFDLRILEPPIEIEPFELYQLWHERVHEDRAHAWLRRAIAEVAREL